MFSQKLDTSRRKIDRVACLGPVAAMGVQPWFDRRGAGLRARRRARAVGCCCTCTKGSKLQSASQCAHSRVRCRRGVGLGYKRSAKLAIDPQYFKTGQHFGLEAHGAAHIRRGWDVAHTKKSALPAVGATFGFRRWRGEMGQGSQEVSRSW